MSRFQPQSRFPKAKIDGEGGTPPNRVMLFDVDFLRAHSYDSKTVGLFEKEKASSFGNFIFWGFSTHGFGGSPHFIESPLLISP